MKWAGHMDRIDERLTNKSERKRLQTMRKTAAKMQRDDCVKTDQRKTAAKMG